MTEPTELKSKEYIELKTLIKQLVDELTKTKEELKELKTSIKRSKSDDELIQSIVDKERYKRYCKTLDHAA